MNSKTLKMWLRPGMKVKRWFVLFIFAMVLCSLALAMLAAWVYRHYDFPETYESTVRAATLQFIPHPYRELGLAVVGTVLLALAVWRMSTSLIAPLMAREASGRAFTEIINEHRFGITAPGLNVVAIGGGTGLSALLRGLKLADINLTAIVTVADDGGSTGRIRSAYNIPAPGDIRNCLVALADDESAMSKLFHYRFDKEDSELAGHSFGNLFITAMTQVSGSFEHAVIESARVLNVRGRVLPSSVQNIDLCAYMADGSIERGESTISHDARRIQKIFLDPEAPEAYEPSLEAILNADLIVLGPGSLYTSVLPNLLVDGVNEAIRWSRGKTAYVCNVATQHGETDHFGYQDHIREVVAYLGEGKLDFAIVNDNPAASAAIKGETDVEVVSYDGAKTVGDAQIIARDVVSDRNALRHDPSKLADVLLEIARRSRMESSTATRPTIEGGMDVPSVHAAA
ncbi:MAG: gluconeogenesis factor YvcK family protein [Thermomicrobiales bacterium]